MDARELADNCRRMMYDAIEERKRCKRAGDFVAAQQFHRYSLWLSSRVALYERLARAEEHQQLTLLPGRAGRRHDDGDAA